MQSTNQVDDSPRIQTLAWHPCSIQASTASCPVAAASGGSCVCQALGRLGLPWERKWVSRLLWDEQRAPKPTCQTQYDWFYCQWSSSPGRLSGFWEMGLGGDSQPLCFGKIPILTLRAMIFFSCFIILEKCHQAPS